MTDFSTVVPSRSVKFNRAGDEAVRIHGSVYLDPYVYGSTRAFDNGVTAPWNSKGGLVRVHKETYTYDILRFPAPAEFTTYPYAVTLDSLLFVGGYLWTVGHLVNNSGQFTTSLFKIDPATFTEVGRYSGTGILSETLATDGVYIYMMRGSALGRRAISNPGQFVAGAQLANTSSQPVLAPINGLQPAGLHAAVYDNGYLYVNNTSGGQNMAWGYLLKVRTSDLRVMAYVEIPVCTDDMHQDADWLYLGVEEANASRNAEATGWGALAVRKSDLARRALPRLGASDVVGVNSYASTTFGSYLVDTKTNSHVYVIDKTAPDTWNVGMSGAQLAAVVLHDATIQLPAGVVTTPNEIHVDNDGLIHSFVWNTSENPVNVSSCIRYSIPGINLSVIPSVTTLAATNVSRPDNSATLNADLTGSGGSVIAERGFMLGAANPPVTKQPAAGTSLGPYSLNVTSLPNGVVYFRAYATNGIGDGVGAVMSFDVGAEPGVLEGVVRSAGNPVAGAKVIAINPATSAVVATSITDAAGKYRIQGLTSAAQYHLTCEFVGGQTLGALSKPRVTAP